MMVIKTLIYTEIFFFVFIEIKLTKEYLHIRSLKQFPNACALIHRGSSSFSRIEFSFIPHQIIFPSAGMLTKQSVEDVVANSWRKTACQFKLLCFIKLGEFCLFREAEAN